MRQGADESALFPGLDLTLHRRLQLRLWQQRRIFMPQSRFHSEAHKRRDTGGRARARLHRRHQLRAAERAGNVARDDAIGRGRGQVRRNISEHKFISNPSDADLRERD